ncbi:hypothetical protein QNA08_07590 [Chelatococcus sp. SYSU_G07232]|uniref:Uncharacterized protein n=1 Tax=Chelatococcus albus TaxID=3047466 RepID=A0ABT7AGY2_9HYPH|nr:hypothetical protein [Chelatococcus sp. SYSU_G07232]MDJ1158094.1 hypothetical protein [Chelatococcus sp. SYSU_G07232]
MFALTIPVSADGLDTIKAELTRELPDVKSSHRCEAIARGLGFRTYAAALAAVKAETPGTAHIRGDLFTTYLADHGFDVRPKLLYHAAAKVALHEVSKRMPKLTMWGIGVGRPRRKEDGSWEDFRDMNAKFRQDRAVLISDGAVKSFLTSLAFLARVTPTKTIRKGTGSYWLKHIAENYACAYPEGEKLGPTYVANGVLIAAALHAGFKIKTYIDEMGYDDLNVSFNMSKPCLEDLDCEIRPDGVRAQDRRHREQMKRYRQYPYGSAAF